MDNQNNNKLQLNRSIIIKTALIFIAAYALALAVWLITPIEDYYGLVITKIASYFISMLKGLDITEIVKNKDIISVGFIPDKQGLTQIIKTTIIKNKWLYLEAILILIFVHFLFVFSLEGQKITAVLSNQGFEKASSLTIFFWEFLWGFVDNMVVRFEPFLIGAYLFLMRNRVRVKKVKPEKVQKAPAQRQAQKKKKPKRKR